jgi:pyridoxine 4-dehydrogenase
MTSLTGRIALGCASYSIDLRGRVWSDDVAAVRYGAAQGLTLVDTARAYAQPDDPAHNERLVAEAVAGIPDVLIATKGGHFRTPDYGWSVENTPERLRADVDASRRNLGQDRLDLFYVHRVDSVDDLGAVLDELDRLREEGRIARVGLSNVSVDQLAIATERTTIDAVQNRRSAAALDSADTLRFCEEHGIPFFAYSPVRPTRDSTIAADFPALSALCDERGVSVYTVLLATLLASSPVMSVISGATRRSSIDATVAAIGFELDDALRDAYRVDLAARGITNA